MDSTPATDCSVMAGVTELRLLATLHTVCVGGEVVTIHTRSGVASRPATWEAPLGKSGRGEPRRVRVRSASAARTAPLPGSVQAAR